MDQVRELLARILTDYREKAANAMDILEEGIWGYYGVTALPEKYRKRLRTPNSIERLNEEIRRRERVIRIFPNIESAIRLIGAMLMEQDETWTSEHRYFGMDEYYRFMEEKKTKGKETAAW